MSHRVDYQYHGSAGNIEREATGNKQREQSHAQSESSRLAAAHKVKYSKAKWEPRHAGGGLRDTAEI